MTLIYLSRSSRNLNIPRVTGWYLMQGPSRQVKNLAIFFILPRYVRFKVRVCLYVGYIRRYFAINYSLIINTRITLATAVTRLMLNKDSKNCMLLLLGYYFVVW
jgi:hypothetical protein